MKRSGLPGPLAVALVLAALVLAACGSSSSGEADASSASAASPSAATVELAGTTWNLTAYTAPDGASVAATTAPDLASMTFAADGSWAGTTGCNRITGGYVQDGSALTLTPGAMTEMACTGPVAAQETAIVAALPLVASFRGTDQLELLSAEGTVLLSFAPGIAGLAGTDWQATGVNNGKDALVSAEGMDALTLSFDAQDAASGQGGCNSFSASYSTTDPDGLAFGELASTFKACEDAVMELEQQYFAALGNVATYQLEGSRLTLRDSAGATQATFEQLP